MLAEELRRLRIAAGLTQETVALRAGITREYVSMLESGKNQPTVDVFIRLSHALGVKPRDLIDRIDRSTPD